MALVSVLLIALLLPESLPRENRKQADGKISMVNFQELWRAISSPIGSLLVLIFLGTVGTSNFEAIFGIYAMDALSYSPQQVGVVLTVVGFVAVIGRGLLTGLFTRQWGEAAVIQWALLAGAVTFLLLLMANSYVAVLLTTGLFVLTTAFFRPAVHSLTSQRATVGQGIAMGLSNSFVSLGRVVGPIWAGLVFDLNPKLPYLSGALILLAVFLWSLPWLNKGSLRTAHLEKG